MSERTERRLSRALAATGTILAGYYALWGGEYDLFDLRELRASHDAAAVRVDSLRVRTDSLRAWGDSLATDPAAIERVARERYSFLRPGERLFLFVDVSEWGASARAGGEEPHAGSEDPHAGGEDARAAGRWKGRSGG